MTNTNTNTNKNTKTREQAASEIKELFMSYSDSDLVPVWNDYCCASGRYDDEIFTADALDEIYHGADPLEVVNRFFFGKDLGSDASGANPLRDYFQFNAYGNIYSSDYALGYLIEDYDLDDVADFVIDHADEMYLDDEITDIISEIEEA